MKLSEFRGKVVLLDFGSHEHCGGCKLVYPRLRPTLERSGPAVRHPGDQQQRPPRRAPGRRCPRRDHLAMLVGRRQARQPGPITTSWNIRGYPTFVLIDHRGVIRSKDLHPWDNKRFRRGRQCASGSGGARPVETVIVPGSPAPAYPGRYVLIMPALRASRNTLRS